MLFFLKKCISFWLLPLPVTVVLLCCGFTLQVRGRCGALGRALVALGILLLVSISNKWLSRKLIHPLETQHTMIPTAELEAGRSKPFAFIIVLGAGHTSDPALSALGRLSDSALARLTEAIRLARYSPEATLVVSGPSTAGGEAHARAYALAAVELGFPRERIIEISTARDTEEEADAVAGLGLRGRIALVTSAWHLPRALGLFSRAGVIVQPCPCDFRSTSIQSIDWRNYTWDTESITRSTLAEREYLGLLWLRIRSGMRSATTHGQKAGDGKG